MTTTSEPTITSAEVRDGFPMVTVEAYRTATRYDEPVEVDRFYMNGGMLVVDGVKIKKNGEPGARRVVLSGVAIPQNVRDALAALDG